jgi:hypothetical protein
MRFPVTGALRPAALYELENRTRWASVPDYSEPEHMTTSAPPVPVSDLYLERSLQGPNRAMRSDGWIRHA